MTDDLFPDAQAKSPRLLWLERHGLCLSKTDTGKWRVEMDENNYIEDDEMESACCDFCTKTGIHHWNHWEPPSGISQGDRDRFWRKVDMSHDCWIWRAHLNEYGYGSFSLNGKMMLAHRFSWIITHGQIPESTPCVCHRCDNPACVRPDHLFLGTHTDNMKDMTKKGRGVPPPSGTMHWSRVKKELVRKGESHGQAKLTEQQVAEIRAKYSSGGYTQKGLAKEFGVSQTLVYNIVQGKRWGNCTDRHRIFSQ